MHSCEPSSEEELWQRAVTLVGKTLGDVAQSLGVVQVSLGPRAKGKIGELVEKALGVVPRRGRCLDFPTLGIEVKSVPVSEQGMPLESVFVCGFSLEDAAYAEWETSWVRAKLRRVLFVPVVTPRRSSFRERRIGQVVLWSPSAREEAALRCDFEEILGRIGVGGIEDVGGHIGVALQMRPKARDGRPRIWAYGPEGEPMPTVARGFYLRRRFVAKVIGGNDGANSLESEQRPERWAAAGADGRNREHPRP